MALNHSPRVVTDGLVLYLDAANKKSLNTPLPTEHGWADWYCFFTTSATYSIVDAGVSIYQRTPAGVVTTVVSATSGPARGAISVIAGNTYYGDGPIYLLVEDGHQCLAPLTVAGTLFWSVSNRNPPISFYVYSPFGNATVNFYDATVAGINSAATSTVTVNQNTFYIYSTTNLGNVWITSNMPVVVVTTGNGSDKSIVHPMANYVYRRFPQYPITSIATAASSVSSFAIYDTVNKVMDMNIADGAGLDANQGLGLEYLSDTYSWGNYLSDYVIVAPYDNTIVKTEYWDTATTSWKTLEVHTMTGGTITAPAQVQRDGSAGVGVTATNINGTAAYFGASQLWRWTSNNPIYLAINDTADDEITLLGWTQASYNYRPRSTTTWTDLSGNANHGALTNGPPFDADKNGNITLNGVNQYVWGGTNASLNVGNTITFNAWFYVGSVATYQPIASKLMSDYSLGWEFANQTGGLLRATLRPSATLINAMADTYLTNGAWHMGTMTFDGVTLKLYQNAVLVGQSSSGGPVTLNSSEPLRIGLRPDGAIFNGKISMVSMYNRALTADEIRQNFNAHRGRFGI